MSDELKIWIFFISIFLAVPSWVVLIYLNPTNTFVILVATIGLFSILTSIVLMATKRSK
jgi:hypothetical protein